MEKQNSLLIFPSSREASACSEPWLWPVSHRNLWSKLSVSRFSHAWLCDPMDCSLPDSSVHGISQGRIVESVAISFSRGSSRPRDWTGVFCIADRFFPVWPLGKKSEVEGYSWKAFILIKEERQNQTFLSFLSCICYLLRQQEKQGNVFMHLNSPY